MGSSHQSLISEILGSFTDTTNSQPDVFPKEDGSFLLTVVLILEINKLFDFELPTDGPKTLNGLITEQMQDIPDVGTTFKLDGMTIEVVNSPECVNCQTNQNRSKPILIKLN